MYYVSNDDLPKSIKERLSPDAQDIYIDAFNASYERFANSLYSGERKNSKRLAHKIAWATMKYRCHLLHIKPLAAI